RWLRPGLGRPPHDAPGGDLGQRAPGRAGGNRQRPGSRGTGAAERAVSSPRLRADLVLIEQTYRGEQSFIVKDPTTHKFFRFRPVEAMVMQSLDGRPVEEAAAALLADGIKVTVAAIEKFAAKLKGMGLCERTLEERSIMLMERLRAE